MQIEQICAGLLLTLGVAACRTGRDYAGSNVPRYAGAPDDTTVRKCPRPCEIRIVSFNVAFARRVEGAIKLLKADTSLRRVDILLLQEMDGEGAERIARALGMWHVYYPAIYHRVQRHDFGNAVLSRFPIVADTKLVLPRPSRYAGTHRTATAATVRVNESLVRVYSTHLGTIADISAGRRRDQLRAIISDAGKFPVAIIGGDMNEGRIGSLEEQHGFSWPTRHGPRTTRFGRWDHIFLKGMRAPASNATGTVVQSGGVSDHHPVWVDGILPD